MWLLHQWNQGPSICQKKIQNYPSAFKKKEYMKYLEFTDDVNRVIQSNLQIFYTSFTV